ncbi:MAG: hypothetical protein ACYSU0_05110 [Planctomycetota bacterium]
MKEFMSRFTFGFLMAQFFPGAALVFLLSVPATAWGAKPSYASVEVLLKAVGASWFSATQNTILFAFLAAGTGMLLHGVNWAVLAWLENHKGGEPISTADLRWHTWRIVWQILLAPALMIYELGWLLAARGLGKLFVDENVPHIRPEHMPMFNFLQDFYLHFGQFFSHMAYALLVGELCLVVAFASMGSLTGRRVLLLLVVYLLIGVFYLAGRIQMGSLFEAEHEILERSGEPSESQETDGTQS